MEWSIFNLRMLTICKNRRQTAIKMWKRDLIRQRIHWKWKPSCFFSGERTQELRSAFKWERSGWLIVAACCWKRLRLTNMRFYWKRWMPFFWRAAFLALESERGEAQFRPIMQMLLTRLCLCARMRERDGAFFNNCSGINNKVPGHRSNNRFNKQFVTSAHRGEFALFVSSGATSSHCAMEIGKLGLESFSALFKFMCSAKKNCIAHTLQFASTLCGLFWYSI